MSDRVQTVWAFLAIDPDSGAEGVVGALGPRGWMPLIGGDWNRVESLRARATEVARAHQTAIRLVRFEVRRDLELIDAGYNWQWVKLQ